MMSYLFTAILLMLPCFGFASPAQPINSLSLTNPAALTAVNPIGPVPIDPRFTMQPFYQPQPLVENDCIVTAVQLLGLFGSDPLTFQEPVQRYTERLFPHVLIENRSISPSGATEARFLVWGLYLGLKDMLTSRRFQRVKFVLRWEGRVIAQIEIMPRDPPGQLSLPGEMSFNSTDTLQERSSSSPFNLSASEAIGRTSFNFSIPPTPSNPRSEMAIAIAPSDRPLPKYSFIMAILEGILAGGSLTPRARLPEPAQAEVGAPFNSRLVMAPLPGTYGMPYMTYGTLALALRQIPAAMLQQQYPWVECNIKVMIDNISVGQGAVLNL